MKKSIGKKMGEKKERKYSFIKRYVQFTQKIKDSISLKHKS